MNEITASPRRPEIWSDEPMPSIRKEPAGTSDFMVGVIAFCSFILGALTWALLK